MRSMGWDDEINKILRAEAAEARRLETQVLGCTSQVNGMKVVSQPTPEDVQEIVESGDDVLMSPKAWSRFLGVEFAQAQPGTDDAGLGVASERAANDIFRIFDAKKKTLPLLVKTTIGRWPDPDSLPGHWASALKLRRSDLAQWSIEYEVDFLRGSKLLSTPTHEQAQAQDSPRRRAAETRTRETLLVLFAALAKDLKFDLQAHGVIKRLSHMCERLGVSVSEDTISAILKDCTRVVEKRRRT